MQIEATTPPPQEQELPEELRRKPNPQDKWHPAYVAIVRKMCQLGATDQDLAEGLGISRRTIDVWKHEHPEFLAALELGKDQANGRVERSLYSRANGYSHPDTKVLVIAGKVHAHEYIKHLPPDVLACIFWLKNRRPDQWRDKLDIDQTTRPAEVSDKPMTPAEWDEQFGNRRAN